MRASTLVCISTVLIASVESHGNMNLPIPRNNNGQLAVDTPPGDSHGPSCLGDACGWFQAGCFIGCPVCSNASNGADVPCFPSTANCSAPDLIDPTLPKKFQTYNIENKSLYGDWTSHHPWRAPGRAPMHDACGLSGAYTVGPGVDGYPPLFPGSQIKSQENVTVWKAGGLEEVAWSIWANHGGGYSYRLCPKNSPFTEDCFSSNILEFADETTTIRSPFGEFADFTIPARDVSEGTYPVGSVWRQNPIPACNCDVGYNCTATTNGTHTAYDFKGSGAFPCPTGYQFEPPFPEGFGYWGSGAHYVEHPDRLMFQLVDKIKVPRKKGEYLLSWRWDCENSPQVWGNCADIVIA